MSADKHTSPPSRTRYGLANPEKAESELWTRAIREGWGGYALRKHFETKGGSTGAVGATCWNYADSSYRDSEPGPYWSWDRFGRTSTMLADGRIIHVAGEHEDYYDPDFCIYNDVIVEHPDGSLEFYLYPKDVFPPTDFHTATLIGDDIFLIGSLGYTDMRRIGETQVLRLNPHTFRIEPVETGGDGPGWISRHRTEQLGDTRLLILGGNVQTEDGYVRNTKLYELDLSAMRWQPVAHGDTSIFPIAENIYHANKNPRAGNANPELCDNPFWHEMLRRKWPPSRARLHYGDFTPPRADKESRDSSAVVWTAVRIEPLEIDLPDGRHFLIGGTIKDYGDESADAWTYNDVIVTHPGGASKILIYPLDVLPDLRALSGFHADGAIYICGVTNWARDKNLPRGPQIYRLDTRSLEVNYVTSAPSHLRVRPNIVRFSEDGTKAVMDLVRQTRNDPCLYIDLDLKTRSWGEPYPSDG